MTIPCAERLQALKTGPTCGVRAVSRRGSGTASPGRALHVAQPCLRYTAHHSSRGIITVSVVTRARLCTAVTSEQGTPCNQVW